MRIPSTTIRLGSAIAAVALSLAFACPAFASSFSDVPDDAWYGGDEGYVAYVAEKGFMTGYAGTDLFGPDDTLTRAQVVTALYRVITGDPDGLTSDPASYVASDESGFLDTEGGMYYTAALNWAVSEDVARGSAGFFRPDDPVTREELVTLLARSVDYEKPPIYASRGDMPIDSQCEQPSEWAEDAFSYARAYRIIEGQFHRHSDERKTYRLFRLHDDATRAEAAAMLKRFNENVVVYRGLDPKIAVALHNLEILEEGYDYESGVLIVTIDGSIAVEGSDLCFGDYAKDRIKASRDASFAGDPEAREIRIIDAGLLALPHPDAVDALSEFGRLDLLSGSNRGGIDVSALIEVPSDMGYVDALYLLAEDERVMKVSLNGLMREES